MGQKMIFHSEQGMSQCPNHVSGLIAYCSGFVFTRIVNVTSPHPSLLYSTPEERWERKRDPQFKNHSCMLEEKKGFDLSLMPGSAPLLVLGISLLKRHLTSQREYKKKNYI